MLIQPRNGQVDFEKFVDMAVSATSTPKDGLFEPAPTFESLFAGFYPMVYGVGLRYLGNHQDAEDAAQEVFAKVWKNLKDFNRCSLLKTWIYRIAINTCIDHGRKPWKRVDSGSVGSAESLGGQDLAPQFVIQETAERQLLAEEARSQLSEAVGRLKPHLRHVFVLKEVEELSYDEISSLLGLSMGTISSRLHRAKKALQESLGGFMAGAELAGAGA